MKMDQECVLARPQHVMQNSQPSEKAPAAAKIAAATRPAHAYMLALVPHDAVTRNAYQQMFKSELADLSPNLKLGRETPPHIPLITFALSGSTVQQQNKLSQIWNTMAQLAADHGQLTLTFASINTRRCKEAPGSIDVVHETMPNSNAQVLRAGLQAVLSNHRIVNTTAHNSDGQRLQLPLARVPADEADLIPESMPDMLGIGRQAKFQLRLGQIGKNGEFKAF